MTPPRPRGDESENGQLSLDSRFAVAQVPAVVTDPNQRRSETRVLAVSDLVRAARQILEARFADVLVEGEISGLRRSGPGHLYFTLKDTTAQIDCVMFSREAARLKFPPADGLLVRCRGRVTIFEGRGKFQLQVAAIDPAGLGALALAFEQLKQKLATEGLFAPERKRPIPFLPRRIGILTSPQGAVLRDVVRVVHRRFPIPILLATSPVQGTEAPAQLIAALARLAAVADVDVIIIARGGGSMEDLWAFNDERLARAIAACPKPVISAVGHETDFTIADFVADLRAPTPSAAAELAVPVAADLLTEVMVLRRRLGRGLEAEVHHRRLRLERARVRLGDPRRLLDERRLAIDDQLGRASAILRTRLARGRTDLRAVEGRLFRSHPQRRIADQRHTLGTIRQRLIAAIGASIAQRRAFAANLGTKLTALSPLKVLERGYSLTRDADGHLVTSTGTTTTGATVTVTLRDGDLHARVLAITSGKQEP